MSDTRQLRPWLGAISYAALLAAFWYAAQVFAVERRIGGHLPSAFASFALLLAPYWAFGFGLAPWLIERLRSRTARVLTPAALIVPYLVFALPRGELRVGYAAALIAIPVGIAALFEFLPPASAALAWQDVVVLVAVGAPVEFRLLAGAWPHSGLGAMPKLLLVDAALYAYLVVRRLPGVGYDLRPRWRDLLVGLREWAFFAPLAIVLGLGLGFIHFHPRAPNAGWVAAGWLVTFFFVALPEELFFRGLLQNLLEPVSPPPSPVPRAQGTTADDERATPGTGVPHPERSEGWAEEQAAVGFQSPTATGNGERETGNGTQWRALIIASVIFGLSHFNKPLPFNWRYVLLATIAGIFYGRAWRDRRRLFSAAITHATVDVVWSVWFRG